MTYSYYLAFFIEFGSYIFSFYDFGIALAAFGGLVYCFMIFITWRLGFDYIISLDYFVFRSSCIVIIL